MRQVPQFIWCGLISLFLWTSVQAQDRCSFTRYQEILNQRNPGREQPAAFEKWMFARLQQLTLQRTLTNATIPVVVHIIHNGESVGSGANLSEAQILSQIDVLNKDFQRANADAVQTPSDFAGVAGQLAVQFVLAKRDPNGLPSNGIVRINGGKASWGLSEETSFKALSYWPAEDYLNIWVLNLSGADIGYSSFPVSTLPGLENASNDRLLDGVISDYFVFGSVDYGAFSLDNRYNKGRTVTHEVGHFLGLRHIWGDGSSCQATDYVDDTPPQSSQTTGCPTHPQVSCVVPKMFQNYMDYTNDACMNIFTSGQVGRMQVVLTNSPRRTSLTTSVGATSPNYAVDAAIQIVSPKSSACPGSFVPQISVQSIGITPLTTVKIAVRLNGVLIESKSFSVSLSQGGFATVNFSPFNSIAGTQNTLTAELLEANGAADEIQSNNLQSVTFDIPSVTAIPFTENFIQVPTGWSLVNPDGGYGWTASATRGGSLTVESYNYDNVGARDALVTPVFDASAESQMLLQFDVAYARYPDNDNESLTVYLLEDCSDGLSGGQVIYQKQGSTLATVSDKLDPFIPGDSDWRRETVPLNAFAGKSSLRLAFVYQNAYGNNFYLDRIRLATGPITNLQLVRLDEPRPAVCSATAIPKLLIRNLGSVTEQNLSAGVSLNGSVRPIQGIALSLAPGQETVLALNEVTWVAGPNIFNLTVIAGSGPDEDTADNSLNTLVTYITQQERPPLRSTFDGGISWNPVPAIGTEVSWSIAPANKGLSALFGASGKTADQQQGWLVSPAMDFSQTTSASLLADVSYSLETGTAETVSLLASLDCGSTFSEVLFTDDARMLNNNEYDFPWTPGKDEDWSRKFFDLTPLAGKRNVLVSLVATNRGGNNLWIDNLEFYLSADPDPPVIKELFRVYRDEVSGAERITFNLEERSTVRLQMLNATGVAVLDNTYTDILNQTLEFELGLPPGVYIYRFFIGSRVYAVRHFVP